MPTSFIPWKPGFLVGARVGMGLTTFFSQASTAYERQVAMGCQDVEIQIRHMMRVSKNEVKNGHR